MAKRKRLSASERRVVYEKMDGHCAYCGCDLRYEDMQVDHVVPLEGWSQKGTDTLDNMLPACRSCNHYKRANTLEGWRKQLEAIPQTLARDSVTYRAGRRFGLIVEFANPKVEFYFERRERGMTL